MSLASLASGVVAAGSYVTVEGTVDPLYRLEIEKRSVWVGRRIRFVRSQEQLLPLVDEAGRIGILMTPLSPAAFSGRLRVTGMVERLPQVACDTLHREAATLPHRLNASVMLASGRNRHQVCWGWCCWPSVLHSLSPWFMCG